MRKVNKKLNDIVLVGVILLTNRQCVKSEQENYLKDNNFSMSDRLIMPSRKIVNVLEVTSIIVEPLPPGVLPGSTMASILSPICEATS
jgi:hypothetical protein